MDGVWLVLNYRSSEVCGTSYLIVHACLTRERAEELCIPLMENDIEDYNWHDVQYLKVT